MATRKKGELKKEESGQLRDYELILIISPDVAENNLETAVNGVSQFINNKGGSISEVERWGKRKLAYPIKRFLEGIYVLFRVKMNSIWSKELEANLRVSEDVLRHMLIKVQ
ncbi:30S ribosomal protein S6 [Chloroflexota bacterium]